MWVREGTAEDDNAGCGECKASGDDAGAGSA